MIQGSLKSMPVSCSERCVLIRHAGGTKRKAEPVPVGGGQDDPAGQDHSKTKSGSDQWNFLHHNRARGQARDGATEGRPEGRDERDRASQIERIFTNGEPLRRRICLQVLFVFISESGPSVQRLDIRAERAHLLSQRIRISESIKARPQP